MKIFSFVFALLLLVSGAGCNTRYVDVRGEKFEMISESEEKELIEWSHKVVESLK